MPSSLPATISADEPIPSQTLLLHQDWMRFMHVEVLVGARPSYRTLAIAAFSLHLATTAHAQSVRPDLPITNGTVLAMARSGNTLYLGGSFTQVGKAAGGALPLDPTTAAPLGLPNVDGVVNAITPDGS